MTKYDNTVSIHISKECYSQFTIYKQHSSKTLIPGFKLIKFYYRTHRFKLIQTAFWRSAE